jgi:alanine dehydrogenase
LPGRESLTMALFLTSQDVGMLLGIADYVDVLECAYRDLGKGLSNMLPRIKVDAAQRSGFLKILPAALSEAGVAGIHAYTGGGQADFLKVILLFDIPSGNLEAVIEADRIGWLTPGAVSAVATKYLARKDARILGVLGSGRQARAQLLALSGVRDLELVRVYSPDKDHCKQFCADMEQTVNVRVVAACSSEEAISGADIVVTATNARNPVFDGRHIAAGTHINAIGAHDPLRREVDGICVSRSKVIADSLERALKEEGALFLAAEEGLIDLPHVYADLGEILSGNKPGRVNPEEITLFLSGATAIEYVAIAAEVYRRAREKGMGQQLSLVRDGDVPRSLYVKTR